MVPTANDAEFRSLFTDYLVDTTLFWEKYEQYDFVVRQELWTWLHDEVRRIKPANDKLRMQMRELIAKMLDHASQTHQIFR